jgi:hypothetical protein
MSTCDTQVVTKCAVLSHVECVSVIFFFLGHPDLVVITCNNIHAEKHFNRDISAEKKTIH